MTPLAEVILRFLQTERGPLPLPTLIGDAAVLPEFIALHDDPGFEWFDIKAAVCQLINDGRVKRTGDVLEVVPESEWPALAGEGRLF